MVGKKRSRGRRGRRRRRRREKERGNEVEDFDCFGVRLEWVVLCYWGW